MSSAPQVVAPPRAQLVSLFRYRPRIDSGIC
jgi:hypothetical protein